MSNRTIVRNLLCLSVAFGVWYGVLAFALWDYSWGVSAGTYSMHDRLGILLTALFPVILGLASANMDTLAGNS